MYECLQRLITTTNLSHLCGLLISRCRELSNLRESPPNQRIHLITSLVTVTVTQHAHDRSGNGIGLWLTDMLTYKYLNMFTHIRHHFTDPFPSLPSAEPRLRTSLRLIGGCRRRPFRCLSSSRSNAADSRSRIHSASLLLLMSGDWLESQDQSCSSFSDWDGWRWGAWS